MIFNNNLLNNWYLKRKSFDFLFMENADFFIDIKDIDLNEYNPMNFIHLIKDYKFHYISLIHKEYPKITWIIMAEPYPFPHIYFSKKYLLNLQKINPILSKNKNILL